MRTLHETVAVLLLLPRPLVRCPRAGNVSDTTELLVRPSCSVLWHSTPRSADRTGTGHPHHSETRPW